MNERRRSYNPSLRHPLHKICSSHSLVRNNSPQGPENRKLRHKHNKHNMVALLSYPTKSLQDETRIEQGRSVLECVLLTPRYHIPFSTSRQVARALSLCGPKQSPERLLATTSIVLQRPRFRLTIASTLTATGLQDGIVILTDCDVQISKTVGHRLHDHISRHCTRNSIMTIYLALSFVTEGHRTASGQNTGKMGHTSATSLRTRGHKSEGVLLSVY